LIMTEMADELDRQLEAFRATWREGGLKDPELTYVIGNLNGFVAHLRRGGFQLARVCQSEMGGALPLKMDDGGPS
jgi:hypothetical protein